MVGAGRARLGLASVSVYGLEVWVAGRNDSLSYCIAGMPFSRPFEPSRADTCRRVAGREGVRWNCAYWSGAEDVGGPPRAARRLGWNMGLSQQAAAAAAGAVVQSCRRACRQARLSLAASRSRPHHTRPTHRYATKAKHGSNQGSAIEPPPVLAHPSAPSPSF
jgi:hypothetical protein